MHWWWQWGMAPVVGSRAGLLIRSTHIHWRAGLSRSGSRWRRMRGRDRIGSEVCRGVWGGGVDMRQSRGAERNVAGMNIEQYKTSRLPKHFGNVERVRPSVFKELTDSIDVFIQHMFFKIRHLFR